MIPFYVVTSGFHMISEDLEMFCFSVMESSCCFANVKFITVPATSFIEDFGPLRSVQAIFVWKIRFDAEKNKIK